MIFKCKMCGGDVVQIEGTNTGRCEYCKSVMTLPNLDNEKIVNLYNRANDLRINNEFDKALSTYENILNIDNNQIEAHWGILLCKYGVEYVDDPKTKKKIPTCHRTLDTSILTDSNYKFIKKESYGDALKIYEEEATKINNIQNEILSISKKEKPYDIFICYKETDDSGERTKDSVIAEDIYDKLTDLGYKVFFARITLESKLGTEYEPYIYSALKTAKVMLVVGTKEENFNAVWVKNEWSRFLEMMKTEKSKSLIPVFSGIDAYKLPEDFAMLQAQSMDKVGAMQDLVRGVKKLITEYKTEQVDGVDKETIAKVKAVLDEVRTIGNGKYEVTIVRETLPVWYYVVSIVILCFIGLCYFLSGYSYIITFVTRDSTLELLYFAKNINPLPFIFYILSALTIALSLILPIYKRKFFKYKNRLTILSYLFIALTYIICASYCYRPSRSGITFTLAIMLPSFILLFINPKWKINMSDKTIMNEEEKNKQLEVNSKIKDNFTIKEHLAKNIKVLIIYIIIIVMAIIISLYKSTDFITSKSNKKDSNSNQVEILSYKYIYKKASDSWENTYIGYVSKDNIFDILDVKKRSGTTYLKIRTSKGITGYITLENTKLNLNHDTPLYKEYFLQSNERNKYVTQIEVVESYINIRKDSAVYSNIIGQVYSGEIYTVLNVNEYADNTIWYRIKTTNGITGWIAGVYKGNVMVKVLDRI